MPDSQGLNKAIAIVFSCSCAQLSHAQPPPSILSSMGNEDPFVPWSHDTGASPRKETVICGGPDYSANPLQRASAPLQIHTSCTNHYRLKWIQPSARHSEVLIPKGQRTLMGLQHHYTANIFHPCCIILWNADFMGLIKP